MILPITYADLIMGLSSRALEAIRVAAPKDPICYSGIVHGTPLHLPDF